MILAGWACAALAGTVSGVVTTAEGEPVEGALAVAYDARLRFEYATTDASGSFAIEDVAAGPYRLRILPSMLDNHQETWLPAGLSVCAADVLDVDGDVVADVTVPEGGLIFGQILDTSGEGVPGAFLIARTTATGTTAQARTATTDVNGRFVIRGLPEDAGDHGEFRFEVQLDGWPRQYFGGAYVAIDGASWQIAAGEQLTLDDQVLLDGIRVGGAVSGPYGPVWQGSVYVYSPSEVAEVPIVDGSYLAEGLPPGLVQAWVDSNGVAQTYAPDRDRPGPGVSVPNEGSTYNSLDIQALPEVRLTGQLHGGGSAVGDIGLLAYNDTRTVALGATSEFDGTFEVRRLAAGRYQLFAYGAAFGFVDDFVRDEAGEVRWFDVPGEPYDVALARGATVDGVVTESGTGAPVYGATVIVETVDGAERYTADADRAGAYRIEGLVAGQYVIRAEYDAYCANDVGWTTAWYPGTNQPYRAGAIVVAGGDHVSWDPVMGRDADRDGMDDVWEAENGLDPALADGDDDADGDGFSNRDEYLLGSDPTATAAIEPTGCGCGGTSPLGTLGIAIVGALARRRKVDDVPAT